MSSRSLGFDFGQVKSQSPLLLLKLIVIKAFKNLPVSWHGHVLCLMYEKLKTKPILNKHLRQIRQNMLNIFFIVFFKNIFSVNPHKDTAFHQKLVVVVHEQFQSLFMLVGSIVPGIAT